MHLYFSGLAELKKAGILVTVQKRLFFGNQNQQQADFTLPCSCKAFTLHCFPAMGAEVPEPSAPLRLELDLGRRVMVKPALSDLSPAGTLAKAVMEELTQDHWGYLWNYFFTLKILYTERANLDELETDFPPNAREGGMVGYYEILPFARPIGFNNGAHDWAFDDQYCLRPDCSCRAAVLQCFQITPRPAGAAPEGPNLSLRYYYDTQRCEVLETTGTDISAQAFLNAMRQTQPDFDTVLAKRHHQLRYLYRLFLQRHPTAKRAAVSDPAGDADLVDEPAAPPARATPKPGRNDPCPCGSGKKYKKCCGKG
jgi:hypothetical protein